MKIQVDTIDKKDIQELLQSHLDSMMEISPSESVHALNIDAFKNSEITLWSLRENGELLGCVALKELDSNHAELKSMKTHLKHLRKGVAGKLLNHVMTEAQNRGYKKISLETGNRKAFEPAQNLYKKHGFEFCKPFADYTDEINSVYMSISFDENRY